MSTKTKAKTTITAEIVEHRSVTVEVDIAQHVAAYTKLRAEFEGTDEEFVRRGIRELGHELLDDPPWPGARASELNDGITAVDGQEADVEVTFF